MSKLKNRKLCWSLTTRWHRIFAVQRFTSTNIQIKTSNVYRLTNQVHQHCAIYRTVNNVVSSIKANNQRSSTDNCKNILWRVYSVSQKIPPPWGLVAIFPKRLGIFPPNLRLLRVPIYARLQIFIQLAATLMKLCHIKREHPVHIMCAKCSPSAETHFLTFSPNS